MISTMEPSGGSALRWWSTLGNLGRFLVEEALSPSRCASCDERLERRAAFCPPCAATIEQVTRQGDPRAFATYGGALATSLRKLKYEGRPDLAAPLGDLACRALPPIARDVVVVPVPLHPARLVARGYNQSALLASRLASKLGRAYGPRALVRVRDTPQQARLSRDERWANVDLAFRVRPTHRLRDREVLLVDDVTTTGATLEACRAALLAGGAARVTAVVVAQADAREEADRDASLGACPREVQSLPVSLGPSYDRRTVSPGRASLETHEPALAERGRER